MSRQQLIFAGIVGAAIILAGVMVALNPLLYRWYGPPDLPATATVMALRATDVSLAATETALEATRAAIRGGDAPATPRPEPSAGAAGTQTQTQTQTWEGLHIAVTNVIGRGWPLVKAQNRFNDPPLQGRRMVIITLRITATGTVADRYLQLTATDFQLVGKDGRLYTTWGSETGCGVVPDELDGVVARDVALEGNVCFQVPQDETGFQLVYDRQADKHPAVYVDLPEP